MYGRSGLAGTFTLNNIPGVYHTVGNLKFTANIKVYLQHTKSVPFNCGVDVSFCRTYSCHNTHAISHL